MRAEILAIGTEILLGEIVDTNTATIARALRSIGVDVFRTTAVGDNLQRIAQAVAEALGRADILITTGGLGPTVDDMTREAIAEALGRPLTFRSELWEQIQERFARFGREPTENNRRQATLPRGAVAIENPVGTAPAFRVEDERGTVIALPGVPAEMTYLLEREVLPYLAARQGPRLVIRTRVLHTVGVGESWVDERIADLETGSNPTVGLAAHPGQVGIRITAKAEDEAAAERLIAPVERELRARLGEAVFGADGETLASVVQAALKARGLRLVTVEAGTRAALAAQARGPVWAAALVLATPPSLQAMAGYLRRAQHDHRAAWALGALLVPKERCHRLQLVVLRGIQEHRKQLTYGGTAESAPRWAANMALAWLRRLLS